MNDHYFFHFQPIEKIIDSLINHCSSDTSFTKRDLKTLLQDWLIQPDNNYKWKVIFKLISDFPKHNLTDLEHYELIWKLIQYIRSIDMYDNMIVLSDRVIENDGIIYK
ncbi:hypothetical protein [Mycoplasma nasistruthionis]|uniref:Uncharacterized protein n=1 Tax=Mycoplasma nasistruthionis TaxID=353852 RepID=A0A4Y6I673_9MOLU|nr:hypothetical protein [Mycoplasma nasistruthionis]QDF64800.1 hypothetical protein FIV53_00515 [Mycoplasma nasistruthionis]